MYTAQGRVLSIQRKHRKIILDFHELKLFQLFSVEIIIPGSSPFSIYVHHEIMYIKLKWSPVSVLLSLYNGAKCGLVKDLIKDIFVGLNHLNDTS